MWPFGLHGHGMHDFILRECEIGTRAATGEDTEWFTGLGVWVDISYQNYMKERGEDELSEPGLPTNDSGHDFPW